jgi:hypothetical protein
MMPFSARRRSWKFDAAFYTLAFDNGVNGVGRNILRSSTPPLGQRISTLVITESLANPKCKRGSLVEI